MKKIVSYILLVVILILSPFTSFASETDQQVQHENVDIENIKWTKFSVDYKDDKGKTIGTLNQYEQITVLTEDDEWCTFEKDGHVWYIAASSLTNENPSNRTITERDEKGNLTESTFKNTDPHIIDKAISDTHQNRIEKDDNSSNNLQKKVTDTSDHKDAATETATTSVTEKMDDEKYEDYPVCKTVVIIFIIIIFCIIIIVSIVNIMFHPNNTTKNK